MADFFPLIRSKQLKPIWEFSTGVLIWRIFNSSHNTIIGETRNQEAKSTSFFCVDARTGKSLWKDIEFDEPWWIGIEKVYDKWIILHRFARPDMPEHRGIHMVELATGKLLWRNDDLTYWFVHDQKLYAYKYIFEKRLGYEIDINTGTVLNEYADTLDSLHELRRQILQEESDGMQGTELLELYNQEQIDSEVATSIRQITGGNALEGRIEYLLRSNILLVSYYRKENSSASSTLENIFTVYDTERRKKRFSEIIVKGVQAPSPDTFFVKDEFVYFIKNQNTLTALRLWKS
ncbi:MAG: DUF4905 domain-containing protein [Bacteroidota bacterium]